MDRFKFNLIRLEFVGLVVRIRFVYGVVRVYL